MEIISSSCDSEKEMQCIQNLRERIKDDANLIDFLTFFEDRFLMHFIRGRKYNTDAAFHLLQNYMDLRRNEYKSFFLEIVPSKLKIQGVNFLPLKSLGHQGEYIIVSRVYWWPFEDNSITFDEALGRLLLYVEEVLNIEAAERKGVITILDFEGFGFRHAKLLGSYYNLQKLINIIYKAMPLTFHQLHFLNTPFTMRSIVNLAKQFIPVEFGKRIHLHGSNFEKLHNHVPKSILPDWMGGPLSGNDAFASQINENIMRKDDYYQRFIEILKKS